MVRGTKSTYRQGIMVYQPKCSLVFRHELLPHADSSWSDWHDNSPQRCRRGKVQLRKVGRDKELRIVAEGGNLKTVTCRRGRSRKNGSGDRKFMVIMMLMLIWRRGRVRLGHVAGGGGASCQSHPLDLRRNERHRGRERGGQYSCGGRD